LDSPQQTEEPQKYAMTLHMAERKLNEFMSAFDMRADFKWFVTSREVTITTKTPVDEKYLRAVIERSKQSFLGTVERSQGDFWIPAITFQDVLYHDAEVQIISDGLREYFVGAKNPERVSQ
jgi:hypothetical protein